ncbi:MAG: bifunctional nuclease family protein [Candidatus Hydrothermarchaeaceae archaeon]
MGSDSQLNGYQKVKVVGVYMASAPEGSTPTPIVLLENKDEKVLPIYIGASEAFSIQTALEGMSYPRPLTHDLLVSMLEGLNSKIAKIIIDDLDDGVFFARIIVTRNGDEFEFDARPSDGMAIAVRTKSPIFVSKKVMEQASVDRDAYTAGA